MTKPFNALHVSAKVVSSVHLFLLHCEIVKSEIALMHSTIYPSRLVCCEFVSFGDVGCREVGPLSNIMELDLCGCQWHVGTTSFLMNYSVSPCKRKCASTDERAGSPPQLSIS